MNGGMYKGKRILKESTMEAMLTPQYYQGERFLDLPADDEQALTFSYESPLGLGREWIKLGHNGADPGTNTFMFFDRQEKVGVIFFTNSEINNRKALKAAQSIVKDLFLHADKFFAH